MNFMIAAHLSFIPHSFSIIHMDLEAETPRASLRLSIQQHHNSSSLKSELHWRENIRGNGEKEQRKGSMRLYMNVKHTLQSNPMASFGASS